MTERIELPYYADACYYFDKIHDWPMAVMLDSCHAHQSLGRYDIISAQPFCTLTHHTNHTTININNQSYIRTDDPFELITEYLQPHVTTRSELPFSGGAIGFLAYDLAWRLESLPPLNTHPWPCPEMVIAIYDWALVVDHVEKRSSLVAQHRHHTTQHWLTQLKKIWQQPLIPPVIKQQTVNLKPNISRTIYDKAFKKIQQHILAGDCYQANLSQRFSGTCKAASWPLYQQMRAVNPAPFAAYLNYHHCRILCLSPEEFIRVQADEVVTKPIKGTRPRHTDPEQDQRLATELQQDAKERAENVMIVDLMRNDLSKNCIANSVQVPQLCQLSSYPAVHHLVSTVTGRLAPHTTPLELLRGCFPGGSITGTPKIRAMEIINEVEQHRRTIYCGSIIAMSFDQTLQSNICIRTLLHQHDQLYCWAGGAIVADSDCNAEYQECYTKIALILRSLQATKPTLA